MEKISFNNLGQWDLLKTDNEYTGAYNATNQGKQARFLSPEQEKKSQEHTLGHYLKNKMPVKHMVNPASGDKEPHILVGRGVGDEYGFWEPNAKGQNQFDWSTHPNHVQLDKYNVVGAEDSEDKGEQIPPYTSGEKGAYIKYWVPVSSVLGTRQYLHDNHLDKDKYPNTDDDQFGHSHIVIKPGRYPVHSRHMLRDESTLSYQNKST
jgi:hypothetical protein